MNSQQIAEKLNEINSKLPIHAQFWEISEKEKEFPTVKSTKYNTEHLFPHNLSKQISHNPIIDE